MAKPPLPIRDLKYPTFPTIVHALEFAATARAKVPAIMCGDCTLTYEEYWHTVCALSGELKQMGATGSRIAVMMRNSVEMAVSILAGMAACAQVAPINPNYTDTEVAPLLKDTEPSILICDAEFALRAKALAQKLNIPHVIVFGSDDYTLKDLQARSATVLSLPSASDPAIIFFTGGTTGVPKGVDHIHSSMMAFCYSVAALWPLPLDEERILNVAPVFHIWGFSFTILYPIYIRAFMNVMAAYKPALVLEEIQKCGITTFAGGPAALYLGLRANELFKSTDFSSLKVSLSGGAPCPAELIKEWESMTGCVLLEAWGMSEGAPITCNPLEAEHKVGSVGIVAAGTDLEVVDLELGVKTMPTGERGEIRVRGAQFTRGYRNRPDETARAIRDGWLYTGDIGYIDEDGYVFLVDRKKEIILVGGYNVYPREVDELLFQHPAILEAVTIGVPDTFSGEAVKAFIVLKSGKSVSDDEVKAYCAEHLVKYKVPTQIEFVDALPRSGVGKINKLELKARHGAAKQ